MGLPVKDETLTDFCVGGLLATQVGGAWYFPAYDVNGNVTQYVDADGHVVASYAYDAFGNTVAESGAMAGTFSFRFSTKYYDSESGLYSYGYRFYSPRLGRWLTRDPIEEAGGVNLYGFCGNDGVGDVDSLGEMSLETRLYSCLPPYMAISLITFDTLKELGFKFFGYAFWRESFVDSPHWQELMDNWFFERTEGEQILEGLTDPRNRDIASNPGFKKLLACWIDASHGGSVSSGRWRVDKDSFQWHFE